MTSFQNPDVSSSDEASTSQSASNKTDGTGLTVGAESTSDSSFSLARSETRAVNRSKILVLCVILVAAAVVGALVYILLSMGEGEEFRLEFLTYAEEIIEVVNYEAQSNLAAIESLSVAITSLTLDRNDSWPNVTISDFELRCLKILELSNAAQISFAPLVKKESRTQWEAFSAENQKWLTESLKWQKELLAANKSDIEYSAHVSEDVPKIPSRIWGFSNGDSGHQVALSELDTIYGFYAPVWQQSPAPSDPSIINYDLLSHPVFQRIYHGMWETRLPVFSEAMDLNFLINGAIKNETDDPHSILMFPVYPFFSVELHDRDDLSGFLVTVLEWERFFQNVLIEGVNGIDIVLDNTCGNHFTYQVNGPNAVYKGPGDLHDKRYSELMVSDDFASFLKQNFSETHEHCEYDIQIFPTGTFEEHYRTVKPAVYTAVIVLVFISTAAVFVFYDYLVQRRQDKVMATAKRTNKIISSLFPSTVRDRLIADAKEKAEQDIKEKRANTTYGIGFGKSKAKNFMEDDDGDEEVVKLLDSKPIADLFPEVTVIFADIVGFTAWSSQREPSQVFTLLETLYAAFDDIAEKRGVFKIETVGDCYVAVAGLPHPRRDHPVVMARFARDILYKMNDLTKRMEVVLGPDTGDLSLRIGLHSGQVTAGVLRGDKSRFQLFGDTMNTTSRIESTGAPNKIHISSETAALLIAAGKGHWVKERLDLVTAKGKGILQTYWLYLHHQSSPSTRSGSEADGSETNPLDSSSNQSPGCLENNGDGDALNEIMNAKNARLIDWNVDVLTKVLKQIQVRRKCLGTHLHKFDDTAFAFKQAVSTSILDEVQEIITLPRFDNSLVDSRDKDLDEELDSKVVEQLRCYVSTIASLYRNNPFHSFEHASHVALSVVKLLARIVAPHDKHIISMKEEVTEEEDDDDEEGGTKEKESLEAILHDHTYGITSDPMTQLACIFSALIHDVDHQGVPNTQLVKENASVAVVYGGKSIAEQNSLDIAWQLLMEEQFVDLRAAIYCDVTEFRRFRQLLVNAVMATDVMDKNAGVLRKKRWEKAFHNAEQSNMKQQPAPHAMDQAKQAAESDDDEDKNIVDAINRKATIVIEHLIQASDVAHTMQHWHVYSRWNERLFAEMYRAYKEGRAEKDPSETWYDGEIGFLEFYVIPLAKKLKVCGVFGVSSDEYLNYALSNRQMWEAHGRERVEEMVAKFGGIE